MEHMLYTHDGVTETVGFDDGARVLEIFNDITGVKPEGERGTEWYTEAYIRYEWSAVTVNMSAEEMDQVVVTVSAPSVGGVPVRTVEGVTVGMTREEATALGARPSPAEDFSDGKYPEVMELGRREVPGTESYMNDGVGIMFMTLALEGNFISTISTGGNDYSDI